jgi:hypothetical protein
MHCQGTKISILKYVAAAASAVTSRRRRRHRHSMMLTLTTWQSLDKISTCSYNLCDHLLWKCLRI